LQIQDVLSTPLPIIRGRRNCFGTICDDGETPSGDRKSQRVDLSRCYFVCKCPAAQSQEVMTRCELS
jgi:hypothetical protein